MKIIAKNSWLLFQAIIPQDYVGMSELKNVFIKSNGIYGDGWSYVLPIRPGEIISFNKSNGGYGYIAFLKSIDNMEVDMTTDFCDGTTSRIENIGMNLSRFTAPQDAKYLWIAGYDAPTKGTFTPIELTINNGYNIIPELKKKHGKV